MDKKRRQTEPIASCGHRDWKKRWGALPKQRTPVVGGALPSLSLSVLTFGPANAGIPKGNKPNNLSISLTVLYSLCDRIEDTIEGETGLRLPGSPGFREN